MTLLVDEEEAREFCRTFLLPYEKPRLFQCMARNKYADGKLSKNGIFLERSCLTFDNKNTAEDNFIRELCKVDVLAQAKMYKDAKDLTIEPDWMVVYVTAYPLDEDDACDEFIQRVLERRKNHRRALIKRTISDASIPAMSRLMSQMQTCLHLSPCRKHRMLKLDVDTKDANLLHQLYASMKETNVVVAVETRGGFHVVIERGPGCQSLFMFARQVNSTLKKAEQWITIEDGAGPMIAIPGTNQGGFTVRLATNVWKEALAGSIDT